MTIKLKQSTASQEIPLGYFVDSTDGNTEETALTIANTDIKLWKMGATTLASKNSGGATHISNGIYYCVLDATDTDTLGALVIFVHVAGALAVKVECEVLAANVYDSLIAASDKLDVDAFQVTANAITASAIADGAIDAGAIAADAITAAKIADGAIDAATFAAGAINAAAIAADAIGASELAADAVAEIADAIWDEVMSGHVTSGTFGQRLQGIRSGTAQAGAAGTITLDASASAVDGFYINMLILITGGTGVGQARTISGYTGATKVADVLENWKTNPDSTSVFVVIPQDSLTSFMYDLLITYDSRLPTALVGGRMDSSVGAMANDVVTAAAIAADAIGSSELAASAVTEIQSGLSTLNAADVRTAVGLASANLDTQLDALPTAAEINAEVVDALTVDVVADSVPADGSRPTIAQALLMTVRFLMEKAVSGTTLTVKKEDGTTAAMTFTLDSATAPTSITRAT